MVQQYGASSHFTNLMRQYLYQKLGICSLGSSGPVSWPRRSPGLTSCDFFIWVYFKDHVFSNLCTTIPELRIRGRAAISSSYRENLQKVVENTEFRLRLLIGEKWRSFQELLNWVRPIYIIVKMSYTYRKSISKTEVMSCADRRFSWKHGASRQKLVSGMHEDT